MKKSKRGFLSFFICLAILFGMLPTVAFADGGVAFETVTPAETKSPGDSFDVSFIVTSNDGMCIANLTVDYDTEKLQLNSMTKGTELAGTYTFTLAESSLLWENDDTSVNNTTAGSAVFFTANFTVREGVASGDTSINLKGTEDDPDSDVITFEGIGVPTTFTPGTVTIAGAAPAEATFKNGAETFTYAQIADPTFGTDAQGALTLTQPTVSGASVYFAGWFTGLDDAGITATDDYYIVDQGTTTYSGVSECRPKYGDTAANDTTYHALWVKDSGQHCILMLVRSGGIKLFSTEVNDSNAATNASNLFNSAETASTNGANTTVDRIKLISDINIGSTTSITTPTKGTHLDLNGRTFTGKLTFKGTTNIVDSSYKKGIILITSGSVITLTGGSETHLSLIDTKMTNKYTYLSLNNRSVVDEITNCELTGSTGNIPTTAINLGQLNDGTYGSVIRAIRNSKIVATTTIFNSVSGSNLSTTTISIEGIENTELKLTGTTGKVIAYYVHSISLGENNTVTADASSYLFDSYTSAPFNKVIFNSATGTYRCKSTGSVLGNITVEKGENFGRYLIEEENRSFDGTTYKALTFTAAGDNYFVTYYDKNQNMVSEVTATSGAAYAPPAMAESFIENHVIYTFMGWSSSFNAPAADVSGVTLFDTANETVSGDISLYAVYKTEDEPYVFHVKITKDGTTTETDQLYLFSEINSAAYQASKVEITLLQNYNCSGSALSGTYNYNNISGSYEIVLDLAGYKIINDSGNALISSVTSPLTVKSTGGVGTIESTKQNMKLFELNCGNNNTTALSVSNIKYKNSTTSTSNASNSNFIVLNGPNSKMNPTINLSLTDVEIDAPKMNSIVRIPSNSTSFKGTLNLTLTNCTLSYQTALRSANSNLATGGSINTVIDTASKLKNTSGSDPVGTSLAGTTSCSESGYTWMNVGSGWYQYVIPVTVTFDLNGGAAEYEAFALYYDPQIIPTGGTATDPNSLTMSYPVRDGYTFDGWYLGNIETEFDFATAITEDITLTAHWTEDAFVPEWNEPTYEWAADFSTVTATRTCSNDPNYPAETETASGNMVGTTVTVEATCETSGSRTCMAMFTNSAFNNDEFGFSYTEVQTIPALGHAWGEATYVLNDAHTQLTATRTCSRDSSHVQTETADARYSVETPATCETAGSASYMAMFVNSDFNNTFGVSYMGTDVIPATGHSYGAPTYTWAADNSTVTAERVCANDASHVETETVNTTSEVTTAATCTAEGVTTYTATFANAAFETQTKNVAIGTAAHTPGEVVIENRVEATCTENGSYDAVFYCTVCGTEISRQHETLEATGHNWGAPTYVWAEDNSTVTATRVCANDANHVETETVNTTYAVTLAATCTTTGTGVYTATFTNTAFTSKSKNVDIPALGHDWNEPTYVWAEDNSTVTATRVCANDANHVETETAATTYAVTLRPTVNACGEGAYTADFTNAAFATQTKTVSIDKLAGYTITVGTKQGTNDATVTETLTCDYGATVTRTAPEAEEGYTFIGWYQPNGKLLTTNATYSHYVTSKFDMEAWYQASSGTVTFMANNKTIKVLSGVSSVSDTDFPEDVGAMDGYSFARWDKTADQVTSELGEGKNVTVTAIYEKTANSFTVTIYNGESETPTYVECTESKDIRLIAESVEGKNFVHWTADGVIVDYNANTWYWATKAVVLQACYSVEVVVPQATALITSATYNAGTKKATFVAKLVVPEGGKIVKAGLVAAPDGYFTGELTADNAQYIKTSAAAVGTSAPFNYTWTKTKVNVNDIWHVRAYLVYTWNNTEYTVYGDLTTLTAK